MESQNRLLCKKKRRKAKRKKEDINLIWAMSYSYHISQVLFKI